MLAYLFALALSQADASSVATPAASPPAEETVRGAPARDYDFVAWCHGALTGHMAMYEQVKPELVSIERPDEVAGDARNDKLQMQAGREYLALYTRALDGVDHGRSGPLMTRRRSAEAQGSAIWAPFKSVPARTQMWAWVGWDLPGRCETAAKALQTRAGMRAALRAPAPTSDAAIGDPAPTGEPPKNIDAALTTAPADTSAPAADPGPTPSLRGPQ